jgi:hypothetical protein
MSSFSALRCAWPTRQFLTSLLALLSLGLFSPAARAQLANSDYKFATNYDGKNWYNVDPDAWNSFVSGNITRMFGGRPDFGVSVDYTNRVIVLGKKSTGDAILPDFIWNSALFGGEGYTDISGAIPLESPYAQHVFAKGGWRYHLTSYVNFDVGGSFNFYNKSVFGQGLPAPWGYKSDSPVWVGFTGNVISSPSIYLTYSPTLQQNTEVLSFSHVFDMGKLIGVPGLYLEPKITGGLLEANKYNGGNPVLGHEWRNGYSYFEAELNAEYEVYKNLYLRLGATWGLNNDGSGSTGIAGTNLGPDNNVSFHAGVLYAF